MCPIVGRCTVERNILAQQRLPTLGEVDQVVWSCHETGPQYRGCQREDDWPHDVRWGRMNMSMSTRSAGADQQMDHKASESRCDVCALTARPSNVSRILGAHAPGIAPSCVLCGPVSRERAFLLPPWLPWKCQRRMCCRSAGRSGPYKRP